jgi:hypothetical protein
MLYAGDIPQNAHPNIYGKGWECDRGYYKSGQNCVKVTPPQNASIDFLGHGWECDRGFKKFNNACIPMTSNELQKQNALEQKILKKVQARQRIAARGGDCEIEYKTNAEVCVEINRVYLDCNKSFTGNYYRDCDATLNYDIETNYSGGSYLDVEVECRVEIEYKGRQTYTTQSDSSRRDESHTLYAYGSDSERMRFNFSFSSYNEITSVKISSAKCKIESVDLW